SASTRGIARANSSAPCHSEAVPAYSRKGRSAVVPSSLSRGASAEAFRAGFLPGPAGLAPGASAEAPGGTSAYRFSGGALLGCPSTGESVLPSVSTAGRGALGAAEPGASAEAPPAGSPSRLKIEVSTPLPTVLI